MAKKKKISQELYNSLVSNQKVQTNSNNVKKISQSDYSSLVSTTDRLNRGGTKQNIAPLPSTTISKKEVSNNTQKSFSFDINNKYDDGYKNTGKKIGDYIKDSSLKDSEIFQKDNKFYYYDSKKKQYNEITNKTGYDAEKKSKDKKQIAPVSEHFTNKKQSNINTTGKFEQPTQTAKAREDKLGLADRLNVEFSGKSDKDKKKMESELVQKEKDNARLAGVANGLKDKGYVKAGAFDDGYQFGDLTKTILSTGGDVITNVTKGIFSVGEGIGDTINYGIAGVADWLGKDDFADVLREETSKSITDAIFNPASETYNKNSVLGEKGQGLAQGVGNALSMVATGGTGSVGKASAKVLATSFASSFGNGMSEAYQGGATDEEAQTYGLISAIADAGTEMMFGGLGKGSKALGISKSAIPVDDVLARTVSSKFKSKLAQNLTTAMIKSSGEGIEEVASGILQGIGKKMTFESDKELSDILKDEQLLDQFIGGAVASGIMQSPGLVKSTKQGRNMTTGYTDNEQKVVDNITDSRFNERLKDSPNMSQKEQNNLRNTIEETVKKDLDEGNLTPKEINDALGSDDYQTYTNEIKRKQELESQLKELQSKSATDMNYSEYNENNQKIADLQSQIDSINLADLKSKADMPVENRIQDNDYLLQRSYTNYQNNQAQKNMAFEYKPQTDSKGKEVKISDLEKNVYDSASKTMNNTKESHSLADFTAKLSKDTGVQYEFTTTEDLKARGYEVKDSIINGLNTDDGKVLINVDSESVINRVVGHETTHLFENTEDYKTLQNELFEYAKTKGDFDKLKAELTETYKNVKGANIDNELTSELAGQYIFSDTEFVQNLSKHRNIFQKVYDEIKHLYKMATAGSKEARQLEKVKRTFEKVYQNNEAKVGDTAKFSIQTDKNGNKYVKVDTDQDIFKGKSLSEQNKIAKKYILNAFRENGILLNDEKINVTSRTANEYTHPKRELNKSDMSAKLKVSTELDNLLKISEYQYSRADDGRHGIAKDGWDYYQTIFKVDNNFFEGLINIAKNGDNKTLYDITKIKKTSLVGLDDKTSSTARATSFSKNNVSQLNNNVKSDTSNKQYVPKIENNTKNSNTSSFSVDSNIKRYDELSKTNYIEYFRKDNGDVRVNLIDSNNNLVNQLDLWSNTDAIKQFGERLGNQLYNYATDNNQTINIGNDINNLGLETDYFMNHRPTESGITADNLINQNVETPMPKDIYEHPEYYFQMNEKSSKESISVLRRIRNNPNAEITIYRATPGNKINNGDWVTLSKSYAEWHNQSQFDGKGNILEMKVKATDVQYAGDDINEFGYFPKEKYSLSRKNNIAPTKTTQNDILAKDVRLENRPIAPLPDNINNQNSNIQSNTDVVTPINDTQENTQETTSTNKTLNPVEIAQIKPENASTTPKVDNIKVSTGNGQSHFFDNIKDKVNMLSEDSKAKILSNDEVKYYKEVTNEDSLNKAFTKLAENGEVETRAWFNKASEKATDVDVAEGWILMKQYEDVKDYDGMVQVAKKMREIGTKAGQTVQAFNIMNRMTPEGMVKYAQSELSEAYEQMIKGKTKKWIDQHRNDFELKPEEVKFIMDNMQEVATMKDGYDKKVKLAEIQKLMTDKIPPAKGQGVKAWMRISMLFNPKTQVRNVAGNALIAPVNAFGDLFASGVDKLVSRKTGVRTVGTTNLKNYTKGMRKGLFESYNDFKKGINTRNIDGNRFEIGEGKSFNDNTRIGKSLNRVDSLLSFMLDAGDRMFYEGSFVNSINNQMILNNTDVVTQEMIDIATQEALSRTWQDNNNYTRFVLNVRKMLNNANIKGYGLGDILIPFAKTPANLTKALVDYSPAGLVSTLIKGNNLKNAINTGQYTAQMQHDFAQSLGKATAGTMLYVLGYALAKAGILSGESDDDKDVSNFMKNTMGVNSYSIKIGNKSFTYDWAQPLAGPFSMMANLVNKQDQEASLGEKITSSLDTAGNIILEQSFMESINTVLSNNDGVATGIEEAILDLPARAIPTFMKQITDMVDGTQRVSFEYDKPLQSSINSIKAKIPGLSQTLAPSVDFLGREIQKYGGKNNIFNVFFNPANVANENVSESAKEIYRVYKQTGDSTILPRVAPYYVNNNGEKIVLDSKKREQLQKKSGQLLEKSLDNMMKTDTYINANDEDKAEMINGLVNYSYNIAQHEVVGTELSQTYEKAYNFTSNGGNIENYYIYKFNTKDMGSNEKERYLYNSNFSNEQKTLLYENITLSDFSDESKYLNYKTSKLLGIDINNWLDYSSQDFKSDIAPTGKTISGSKKNKLISFVNSLNLSIPQKASLIKMSYSSYDNYDNQIMSEVNSLNISFMDKAKMVKTLGFDEYDKSIINYVDKNYLSMSEKTSALKDLGFTVYTYKGRMYVR